VRALVASCTLTQLRMSYYSFTSADRLLRFLYLRGWAPYRSCLHATVRTIF